MPATKGKSLTALSYHSSVALASVIMKTFDHIVKSEVLYAVCAMLKSTQFALSGSERNQIHPCLLFINFSSAFNFIHPYFLAQRLSSDFNVAVSRPTYFLTTRSHRVGLMYLVGAHHPLDPFGVVCFHRFYLFYLLIKVRAVRSRIIVRCVDDSVIIFCREWSIITITILD